MITTTLADQLYFLCQKLQANESYDGHPAHTALSVALEIPVDTPAFYSALISIRNAFGRMIDDIKADDALDDENKKYFLGYIQPIPSYFKLHALNSVWKTGRETLKNAQAPLKLLANFHRMHNKSSAIEQGELDNLTAELSSLADSINSSEMPDDLKQFASAHVRMLTAALQLSQFVPVDYLWDMAIRVFGDMLRERRKFEAAEGTDEKSTFSKFNSIVRKILDVCDFARAAEEGCEAIESLAKRFPALTG